MLEKSQLAAVAGYSTVPMAKKRKAGGLSKAASGVTELDPKDSRKAITTFEDIADSDDEFHLGRDEVLLGEEPDAKRRRKHAEQEAFLEQSDEEVLGYSDESSEDEDQDRFEKRGLQVPSADDADQDDNSESEEEGWGTSAKDLYGADAIETEEQALEEEAEALRLQRKQLEALQSVDYGFDESEWAQDNATDKNDGGAIVVTETLPQLHVTPDMTSAERLKLLKARYPEFEFLSKELLKLTDIHSALIAESPSSPVTTVKLRAASAYLACLTMYFSLLTSPASTASDSVTALSASKLRDHPVMKGLLQCRELWLKVSDLRNTTSQRSIQQEMGDTSDEFLSDEVEALSEDLDKHKQPSGKPLSRAERHAEAAKAAAAERRAEQIRRTEADLADLDALLTQKHSRTKRSRTSKLAAESDSDLGEEAPLTEQEVADKALRKKSLRFYTSQIAQKANRRGAAGRNVGGDDDIPYRERLKDRQARLNAEAEKRGRRKADIGDDLGGDSDEEDHRVAQQLRADEDDGYYDLVAARTTKKKSDKAALAAAQREAALQGGHVVSEETVGEDGKRKISYAIEKNKGLTPFRKKDVRNPRVKKRKKYEEKKKKLASIKPIYKGGEGRGGYGGELTGIKKGLVKSTKL